MGEENDKTKEVNNETEGGAEDATAKEKAAGSEKAAAAGKPLEKMTVKDLRELAKDLPQITGVHGMKKDELIFAIKEVKGIKDEPLKKADDSLSELKKKIRSLKIDRQAAIKAKDKKMATIYKRRISRLKKKTRRAAA